MTFTHRKYTDKMIIITFYAGIKPIDSWKFCQKMPFEASQAVFRLLSSQLLKVFLKEVCVGSGTRFSLEFSGQSYMVFCIFLWSV